MGQLVFAAGLRYHEKLPYELYPCGKGKTPLFSGQRS
jgi:hypothetical protein